jgi:hypothetical protein
VVITVDDAGTLPLLQQMAATTFNTSLGHDTHNAVFTYPSRGAGHPGPNGMGSMTSPQMMTSSHLPAAPVNWSLSAHTFGSGQPEFGPQDIQDDESMDM